MRLQKQKNQGVQCTIQNTNIEKIKNVKHPTSTKSNTPREKKEPLESSPKVHVQSKSYK